MRWSANVEEHLDWSRDSASTERATELALELAQAHGAALLGLAIIDEPDIKAGAAMASAARATSTRETRR